jgi:hypothetical protein
MKKSLTIALVCPILLVLLAVCLFEDRLALPQGSGPPVQPPAQVYNEMRLVYLSNLERQSNGLPPLRWNVQMTNAARWFSWDSVENRPAPYCGHEDTLGRLTGQRVPTFGYRGVCGAENVVCSHATPEQALQFWMDSATHQQNLLDPAFREVGVGYYYRESDGRGYVVQDLGRDSLYPPVVIENEALHTPVPTVTLYVYDRQTSEGFASPGPAADMMVSNDAHFRGASWEPFAHQKVWSLEPGSGWRTVYVKTRDAIGRATVVSDTIYLGQSAPLEELGLHLASSSAERVTVCGLDSSLPYVQFSHNWFVDDTYPSFELKWGQGIRVGDAAALGGTAFRLSPGAGDSFAWVWASEFFRGTPFVAYFRLKVSDATSADEVARVAVAGGVGSSRTVYGSLDLRGTDFAAAGVYQTFPVAFTFQEADALLFFDFERSGQAEVYVDGVYIFSAPLPLQSPFMWTVPSGNYRGGGIWLRYTNGAGTFSPIQEADLPPERLSVSPSALYFLVEQGTTLLLPHTLSVQQRGCAPFTWSVNTDAAWLQAQPMGETVMISVDTSGLASRAYQASVSVEADEEVLGSPAQVPVTLWVSDQVWQVHLPVVLLGP